MEGTLIQTSIFRDRRELLNFLGEMLDDRNEAYDGFAQASILLNDDGLWECSYPAYTEETNSAA